MRLIDADALMKIVDSEIERVEEEMRDAEERPNLYADEFRKHKSYTVAGMAHIAQDILEAPTIDAVPVVRCKDCVHGTDRTDDFQEEDERWDAVNPIACMMYSSDGTPDFFPKDNYCGFGERKDDEPLMEHEVYFGKEE